jgi:hypothetical protein
MHIEKELKSLAEVESPVVVVAAQAALLGLYPKNTTRFRRLLLLKLRNDKNQFVSEWLVRNPDFIGRIRVCRMPIKTLKAVLESCRRHRPALALRLAHDVLCQPDFPAQPQYWQEALWCLARIANADSDAMFADFLFGRLKAGPVDQLRGILVNEPAVSLLKRNFWALVLGTNDEGHWNFLFEVYRARATEATLLSFLENGYQRGGALAAWILSRLAPALFVDGSLSPTFYRSVSNARFVADVIKRIAESTAKGAEFLQRFAAEWTSARNNLKQRLSLKVQSGLHVALLNTADCGQLRDRLVRLSHAVEEWASAESPRLDATLQSRSNSVLPLAAEPSRALVEQLFQGQLRSPIEFALFAGANPWAIDLIFGEPGAWPKAELVAEQIVRSFVIEAGLRQRAEAELRSLARTVRVELGVVLRETLYEIEVDIAGYFAFRDILDEVGFHPVMPKLGESVKQADLDSQRHKSIQDPGRRGRLRVVSLGLQVDDAVVGSGTVMNSGDGNDRD